MSDPNLIEAKVVNTQDPNLNVGLPVFTIHGNHDDPAGPENLSAVDVLSTVHYVNYFGKHVFGREEDGDIGRIELSPILLQKVCTPMLVCTQSLLAASAGILHQMQVLHSLSNDSTDKMLPARVPVLQPCGSAQQCMTMHPGPRAG